MSERDPRPSLEDRKKQGGKEESRCLCCQGHCSALLHKLRVPGASVARDGIEHGEQLSHAGDEHDLGRLSCSEEPVIETADGGVEAARNGGGHVEDGPYRSAP